MANETIARQIAARVFHAEARHARMLGLDDAEVYGSAFTAYDETFTRALAPDRPAVWPTFRPMPRG